MELQVKHTNLIANIEKAMPRDFISEDGFHITEAARRYLAPLIEGEDYPPYQNGLPQYVQLKLLSVPKIVNKDFTV